MTFRLPARETTRGVDHVLLFIGVLLRLALAVVNREANDPHVSVIRMIADEGRIPGKLDAWEGFQPKLYHLSVAAVWQLLSLRSAAARQVVAQLMSCGAGVATMFLVASLLRSIDLSARARLASLAVVALSPSLIGISAQATNDSFVIAFVTAAVVFCDRFLAYPTWTLFAATTGAASLAGLSKGNGLVVVAVIAVGLGTCLAGARMGSRRVSGGRAIAFGAAFAALSLSVIVAFGPYAEHYREFGSPFVTNWGVESPPKLFEPTPTYRPGIRSIASGFFTFRILDLLEHPILRNDNDSYPESRTSLWSLLYGRFHFSRYPAWPPSWATTNPWILRLGRATFVLALLPSAVLVLAIGRGIAESIPALLPSSAARPPCLVLPMSTLVIGYLAFIVAYALRYRDYPVMKDIFVLPAVAGLATLFSREIDTLGHSGGWRARLSDATVVATSLLACAYVVDVSFLVADLA